MFTILHHSPAFIVLLLKGLVTVSPQPVVTSESLGSSTENSLTTSATTLLSTTGASVSLTVSISADVTEHTTNPSNVTIPAEERITPFTNDTHMSVTSSSAPHTDPYHLLNSSTLNYSRAVFSPTQEMDSDGMRNETTTYTSNPGNVFSLMPEESSTLENNKENQNNSINKKTKRGTVVEGNIYLIFHK